PDTLASDAWVVQPQRIDHRSYVGAPIRISNRTEGFINVNSSRTGQFTHQDAERLRAFANHAAIALRNAELFLEAQQHADELERRVATRTEELQVRTAWSEAILRSTSDGILVTDGEGSIIQANPIAARWLDQNLRPEDADALRNAIKTVVLHATDLPEQLLALAGVDLELRASPIDERSTAYGAVVVAIHDVTHLRALDRMKSQFISDVSHELRTPIAAIRLYASLIQKSPEDRRKDYFAFLDQELDRITRLVEGILQIARLEAGHVELKLQLVDLGLLITTAAQSYTTPATAKDLEITYDVPPQQISVSADPAWLIVVVDNLIENALLYTDQGTIFLKADIATVGERRLARLQVRDTGIGIPSDEFPHIFGRFFRGDEARTRQIPGSGLGLAIVKGILDVHGGQITVDSTVGHGTTITVLLPLAPRTD
ncbi:MAG: hypothetical protein JXC32_04315, partial [Anaerolineae bacterium]|nr:hypothetical protein [Anaerolineae bacterium]